MLETGERDLVVPFKRIDDFDDGGHGLVQIAAVEFQADRLGVRRHPVENENAGGDQPVTALLLDARQSTEELVGDILPQPRLAKHGARKGQDLRLARRRATVDAIALDAKPNRFLAMDLAQIVIQPFDFEPVAVRHDHAPGNQIVERRAP